MPNTIRRSRDGHALLHIWRTGEIYQQKNQGVLFSEWNNVYFSPLPQPSSSHAIFHDLGSPLPFEDKSFDGIYACRVMEHLSPKDGDRFIADLCRLLKPGGVCRLSTPDLEELAEEYLRQLKRGWEDPAEKNLMRFYWIKLQMLDQMVRERSGGDMWDAIQRGYYDSEYAKERFEDVFEEFLPRPAQKTAAPRVVPPRPPWLRAIRRIAGRAYRSAAAKLQAKPQAAPIDPRRSFEADKWLHDRLSLRICLEQAGFRDYRVKDFRSSDIPGWDRFQLDKSKSGDHALEPSIYVEARSNS
jgi:predicted SAM-dependent methyltransferase